MLREHPHAHNLPSYEKSASTLRIKMCLAINQKDPKSKNNKRQIKKEIHNKYGLLNFLGPSYRTSKREILDT